MEESYETMLLNAELEQEEPDNQTVQRLVQQGAHPRDDLRPRLWRLCLLGSAARAPAAGPSCGQEAVQLPADQERVLEADVPRTRREITAFQSPEMHEALAGLLSRWCMAHDAKYRQGLNEVRCYGHFLAPPCIHVQYRLTSLLLSHV